MTTVLRRTVGALSAGTFVTVCTEPDRDGFVECRTPWNPESFPVHEDDLVKRRTGGPRGRHRAPRGKG